VAIVGINGLTNSGKSATCQSTMDASRAAIAVHYANQSGAGSATPYPTDFASMIPNELTLSGGVTNPTAATLTANGWTITMTAGGAAAPVLTATGIPAGTVCK